MFYKFASYFGIYSEKTIIIITFLAIVHNAFGHRISEEDLVNGVKEWRHVEHIHQGGKIYRIDRAQPNKATKAEEIDKAEEKPDKAAKKKTPSAVIQRIVKGIEGEAQLALAGQCYVPIYVPPSCQYVTKRVLKQQPYNETKLIPAVTKQVERKVLVEEAKIIEEFVPALYEDVKTKKMIEPARAEWKKGNFTPVQKEVDGEIYCLIEIPARYEMTTERVLRVPASTIKKRVPAVYKTYKETVVVKPAQLQVLRQRPASYQQVKECVEQQAGYYEWRSVLCDKNATIETLTEFEQALSDKGYIKQKNVDGVIDEKTVIAIKSYQKQLN